MLLSEIRGQNPAVGVLTRALATDKLAQAYLFEGPSGVGKQHAALALAQALLCPEKPKKGCGSCPVCTRIVRGNHPDVRVFSPRDEGARNISVESLRADVLPFAQYAPFEAQAAFLIFPEADVSFPEQHPEGANALLKTLEEPRPRVHFVLLAERPDRLLVTIRSRCQRVRFGRLPPLVLEHVLESASVPQDEWETAIALADGRADRALMLAQEGKGKALLERALRIDATVERGATGRLIELSEELAKAPDLSLVLDMLAIFYRDVAACALGMEPRDLFLRHERERVAAQAQKLGAGRASARVKLLGTLGELFSRNANPQITLDSLFLELARVR